MCVCVCVFDVCLFQKSSLFLSLPSLVSVVAGRRPGTGSKLVSKLACMVFAKMSDEPWPGLALERFARKFQSDFRSN